MRHEFSGVQYMVQQRRALELARRFEDRVERELGIRAVDDTLVLTAEQSEQVIMIWKRTCAESEEAWTRTSTSD